MKLTGAPGEIYFIAETDRLTGETSPYVKVGLVKAGESRDSALRLDEHQTGNPRRLALMHVVTTAEVHAVETTLHGMFATRRVLGEWFHFPGDVTADAVRAAEDLAGRMAVVADVAGRIETLKNVESNGQIVAPTDELLSWHASLLELKAQVKLCKAMNATMDSVAVAAAAEGRDATAVVEVRERQGRQVFNMEEFQANHPDLWAEYVVQTSKIDGKFTIAGVRALPDPFELNPRLAELSLEVDSLVAAIQAGTAEPSALNRPRLVLREIETVLDLEETLLDIQLRDACAEADGIDGICAWKRVTKVQEKFDQKRFAAEQPELVQKYTTRTDPTQAVVKAKIVASPE